MYRIAKRLGHVIGWSVTSKLLLSPLKNFFYSTVNNIDTNAVPKVSTHRDLRVIISSDLDWVPHHKHIISKAYKIPGLLQLTFSSNITTTSKKQLYIMSDLN